jgi:hypothetical protein
MFNRHSTQLVTSGVFALLFTLRFVGAAVVPAETAADGLARPAHVTLIA